jgi:hypothetical protein
MSQGTSQDNIILTDLEEQLRTWSLNSEGSKGTDNTRSTVGTPYISLLRHQKKSSDEIANSNVDVKMFTEPELSYIGYVVDALYALIVDSALDKSGVQYRNTFAWKYLVQSWIRVRLTL